MIPLLAQFLYGFRFLTWHGPDFSIHAWRFSPLVFRHSSYGKCFATKRASQDPLQGFHLAPFLFFRRLDDTHLEPTHVLVSCIPVDGIPVRFHVGNRTSIRSCLSRGVCRHLPCFLSRFAKLSRHERPGGSLLAFA